MLFLFAMTEPLKKRSASGMSLRSRTQSDSAAGVTRPTLTDEELREQSRQLARAVAGALKEAKKKKKKGESEKRPLPGDGDGDGDGNGDGDGDGDGDDGGLKSSREAVKSLPTKSHTLALVCSGCSGFRS